MHRGAYDFHIDRNKDLATEAERAVDRIYTAGLMFRGGTLGAGGNNVMADSAANAFTAGDLQDLTAQGTRAELCAQIITLRQSFAKLSTAERAQEAPLLKQIYNGAQLLKQAGWTPSSEPHRVGGFSAPRP